MVKEEKKYRKLRIVLFIFFAGVFITGLVFRGITMSSTNSRTTVQEKAKSGWKTANIENLASAQAQSISERREIMDRLRQNPSSSELHIEMGNALARDGLLSDAMSHFIEATRLDPTNAVAFHNLGIIHEYLEAYDEAREYFEKAEKLDPENKIIAGSLKRVNYVLEYKPVGKSKYEADLGKATTLMGKKNTNLEDARLILEKLVADNPEGVEALNALGIVYARFGDNMKAEETFFKVISEEPGYIYAYLNLATIYESRNDFSKAFEFLERAANLTDDRASKRELEQRMRELSGKMPREK